jgi:hypothetical protein
MGIIDLFSKRQRRARGEMPDAYRYDDLPNPLRVQIIQIIQDAIGIDQYGSSYVYGLYEYINGILCREYGLFRLIDRQTSFPDAIFTFFLQEESVDKALDIVELFFKVINTNVRKDYGPGTRINRKIDTDEAISELNQRFKEHGIGYQFESNEIIRIDSNYLHAEAVKPALSVLRERGFEGVNEEFLSAHGHYRHGRFKECLVDSLKAFESTMKAICKIRNWTIKPDDTAKMLIATCLSHGLFPSYLESQIGSLRSLLESGIPTIRNKEGGHGQGPDPKVVPEYLARYTLNLTASSILFLVEVNASNK